MKSTTCRHHLPIFFTAFLAASLTAILPQAKGAETKPNILFIYSDDHAQRLIGAYDGSLNKTPNLDRIAHEGAIFNNSFVGNSICCPCRATVLTGKHSHLNGVLGHEPSSRWNGTQWVYPRELANAGYQTALIGKWHMIPNPTNNEFQHWEVLSGYGGQGSYYNPDFIGSSGPSKVIGYSSDIITDKALDWLKQRDPAKPFLLCVQYKTPHIPRIPAVKDMNSHEGEKFAEPPTLFDDFATRQPFVAQTLMAIKGMHDIGIGIAPTAEEALAHPEKVPQDLKDMTPDQLEAWHKAYDPRNREYQALKATGKIKEKEGVQYLYQRFISDYVRCVDNLDENTGRLLDYLDKSGLAKDTIVVYSSDQGFFAGEHGWAEKRFMYEEGFRTPLMIRWPGVIKPGTKIDALVQNIDMAPTFLTAAGIKVPEEVQGKPLQPVLGGITPPDWRKDLLYTYYDGGIPGAPGDYNMPRHMGVRDARYKLIHYYDYDAWEFYDLQSDPHELNNRYADPACAGEVARLKQRLSDLKEEYKVPEPAKLIPKKKKEDNRESM